jgi:chemotaxis protein CheY-P-specific phosphatase CheC
MMQADWQETVKKICFDVLEQLAFMFCDELEKADVQSSDDDFLKATMVFSGHHGGAVDIIVPRRLTPALVYNILGMDEDDLIESDIAEDALKELLNTLCGRMLPALFNDVETFDLHPPEITTVNKKQWMEMLNRDSSIAFAIEDSPVLLNVHFAE